MITTLPDLLQYDLLLRRSPLLCFPFNAAGWSQKPVITRATVRTTLPSNMNIMQREIFSAQCAMLHRDEGARKKG